MSVIRRAQSFTAADLDELIELATVDAYDEAEQRGGFLAMIGDNLAVPFDTKVLEQDVTVVKIDFNDGGQIVAICTYRKARQAISVLNLPLPNPPPKGIEWIEAYRRWCRL